MLDSTRRHHLQDQAPRKTWLIIYDCSHSRITRPSQRSFARTVWRAGQVDSSKTPFPCNDIQLEDPNFARKLSRLMSMLGIVR